MVSLFEILRVPILFSGRNFVSVAMLIIVFRFFRRDLSGPLAQ
jgi:hypothetical protein